MEKLLALSLLLLPAAIAQDTSASVEGKVTNSLTNEPVKRATVNLRGPYTYIAETGSNGLFRIDGVEPGTYKLSANREGFASEMATGVARRVNGSTVIQLSENSGGKSSVVPVTVSPGQHIQDITVKLIPLATVSGKVLDDDGDPVGNAAVEAMHYVYQQGRRELRPAMDALTNDRGEYRLFDLQPGNYVFRAQVVDKGPDSAIGIRLLGPRPPEAYDAGYFPGVREPSRAAPIPIAPGSNTQGLDFRLSKSPRFRIRGKVVDGRTGQPARSVIVNAFVRDSSAVLGPTSTISSGPGTFELQGYPPGSYVVQAERSDSGQRMFARQPLEVANADVDGLVLTLAPGIDLAGVVRGVSPDMLKNVSVRLQPDLNNASSPRAIVAADATFLVSNIPPAAYRLQLLNSPPGTYVKQIRAGDQDLPAGRIDLNRPSGPITFLLATDPAQLEGSVQKANGEPIENATVALVPDQARPDFFKTTTTGAKGNFKIAGIAPGDYKLFAWEDPEPGGPETPEFRKPFEPLATRITLKPNAHETIQLKPLPTP